jgi:hypothetical protein
MNALKHAQSDLVSSLLVEIGSSSHRIAPIQNSLPAHSMVEPSGQVRSECDFLIQPLCSSFELVADDQKENHLR